MNGLLELLLDNPVILTGVIIFTLFIIIVSILKKVTKKVLIIIIVILFFSIICGATIQEKYGITYDKNILTATFQGKEIKIDFNKIAGAKIETQKTEAGINLLITYKSGKKNEIVVPNFIYHLIKYKVTPVKLKL